ncbi:hypothetical protein LEP1GSC021_2292 [Leptospira noguchii str. 1993005606]|uniref:Uncharacterized protein n=1 Tax=Leptospira noguchii str. 2007001578 TaxID=1049974 RepID=A0ABN0J5A9_9LEPT|nr:hypothetical protein LEP1GSC035_2744 [Leptospira noguchii str. 2007001578]EPE84128.1 hypothetical protein LEP1GSC021_2292 [Leptospira noguchii str. 1993005606]
MVVGFAQVFSYAEPTLIRILSQGYLKKDKRTFKTQSILNEIISVGTLTNHNFTDKPRNVGTTFRKFFFIFLRQIRCKPNCRSSHILFFTEKLGFRKKKFTFNSCSINSNTNIQEK